MANRRRILLAAHEGRKALENRLKRAGWQVDVTVTLPASETRLGRTDPSPDVLVVDYGGSQAMGNELTPWVRRQQQIADLPVLAVTMNDSDEVFLQALRSGASDLLAMPFSADDAAARIDALLETRAASMAQHYGTEDPVALRRSTLLEAPEVADDDLRERLSAADAALADEALRRATFQVSVLPEDLAAPFNATPAPDQFADIDDAYRLARSQRRLKDVVCGYDFKHPARFNKTQIRTLETLHEEYARRLAGLWTQHMRSLVSADVAFVDQTTYGEFIASLSNPNVAYQWQTSSFGTGHVVMDIAMPLVFALVDRVHGGKGSPAPEGEPRQVSQIEMGVLARFVRGALWNLEDTWSAVLGPTTVHDIELETNPEFMQVTAKNEIVLLLGIEINSQNASGMMLLCYPFFTLQSILHRLDTQPISYSDRTRRSEDKRPANRLRLGGMRIPAVAEVGRTTVSVGEVNQMKVGDVVRLDTAADAPATVFLGGKPKLLGWPVQDDSGQLGLRVAGRMPPQWEAKRGRTAAEPAS